MWRLVLIRAAYLMSLIPIPALVLSLLLLSVNSALGSELLGGAVTTILWLAGIAYLLSVAICMLASVAVGSRLLLLPPVISVIDLGLFAVFLPPNDIVVGWRTIDAILLGLLCVLNVVQVLLLRRRLYLLGQQTSDDIENAGHASFSHE